MSPQQQQPRQSEEYLPAYTETMKGRKSVDVLEKEPVPEPQKPSKMSSIKKAFDSSTFKSILTGDVHKYHPMYRLEESTEARIGRPGGSK